MTEALLDKPYWVVDILPEQVPPAGAGQYFAVERFYLSRPAIDDIHRRFTDVLLKLNCYSDLQVSFSDSDQQTVNPPPEQLSAWINTEEKDLCILLAGEHALITLNHDDIYMTVYNPSSALLDRIGSLAAANGLFLRKPPQGGPG